MTDRSMQVGKRIKTMRMQQCLSQSQLAKKMGISQAHLSNIECGRSHITLENLLALHDVLNVRMADFFVDIDGPLLPSNGKRDPVVNLNDMIDALMLIKNRQLENAE